MLTMKYSVLEFIKILLLLQVVIITYCGEDSHASYQSCPNRYTCTPTSSISDLICFSNDEANGFRYGYIDFDNGIVALCKIFLDCELRERSVLNIIKTMGYFVNLTYPNGTEVDYNLYYIDLSEPGCPQVSTVTDFPFVFTAFAPAIPGTPTRDDLAYLIIFEIQNRKQDYNAQCNVFPSVDGRDCSSCSPSKPSRTRKSYSEFKTISRISFAQTKSCLIYTGPNRRTGQNLINQLGLADVNCTLPDDQEPGSDPALDRETCTTNGSDTFPFCRDVRKSANINDVLKSYGYDRYVENLDQEKVCTISTLWAQGYNRTSKYENNYASCNCDSFTSDCTIIVTQLFPSNTNPFVPAFTLLRGYCQNRFKEEILSEFFKLC